MEMNHLKNQNNQLQASQRNIQTNLNWYNMDNCEAGTSSGQNYERGKTSN